MWMVPTAAHAVWVLKIWRGRLRRDYAALLIFNIASLVNGVAAVALLPLDVKLGGWSLYSWVWVSMHPIIWISFFAVTAQLFGGMLDGYPILQRTGRFFLFGVFGLIFIFGALVPTLAPMGAEASGNLTRRLMQADKSVYLATSLLAFALFLFRRFFYLKVVRNVDVAFLSFGLYFSGIATLLVLRGHVGPDFVSSLLIWSWAWSSVCLGLGAYLFKPSNERIPQFAFTPPVRREMLQAASKRLEAINNQLARALAS